MSEIKPPARPHLDRQDVRVAEYSGIKGYTTVMLKHLRTGNLGSLPVVIGLIVIAVIFQSLNSVFLSSTNLVNLLYDSAAVGMIALGVVMVLMLGQIDLSVGSISGMAAAIVGVLWIRQGLPVWLAITIALASGAIAGLVYGLLYIRFGMPSFVSTLAGLLAFLGLQLALLGSAGSINLPFDSWLVKFGQQSFVPGYIAYPVAVIAAGLVFLTGYQTVRERQRANLSATSLRMVALRALALLVVLVVVIAYLQRDHGLPWMFVGFVAAVVLSHYALVRTSWGRHMFAVGGSIEAARRAGIKVKTIFYSGFVFCTTLAALGGILGAARLASASQSAGTGDVNLNAIAAAVIGGTSLFGGRGSAYSALLGILVIQSISNGLTLMNLTSAPRFMITGGVLAIAVLVDSLSRRSREAHGTA